MKNSEKLFVYGTLQEADVQKKVLGRILRGIPSSLSGFRKSTITIDDILYPIIEEDKYATEDIHGFVLEIEEEYLKLLDVYEGDEYRRKRVTLNSGLCAWVYQK